MHKRRKTTTQQIDNEKKNIKLGMKKDFERQIPRRTKILKFFCLPTNGTFAFALTHKANPSAKSKEPFLADPLFFSTFELLIN
jgi:hypothetical protein